MIQPKNSVISGVKALYLHQLVSFNPDVVDVVFRNGTNIKYYKENRKDIRPTTQLDNTLHLYTVIVDGYIVYSKERLLVEIHTFELDAIIKKEAIKNLYKKCDPELVFKILKEFKSRKRFKPSEESINFVEDKKVNFLNIVSNGVDIEQLIREYAMNRLYEDGIISLYKGGSVVEVYTKKKRGTLDADVYCSIDQHDLIVESLQREKDGLRFYVEDFNEANFETIEKHKRARIRVKAIFKSAYLASKVKEININLDIDYSLSHKLLMNIVEEYKLKAINLWKLDRKFIPISKEMLIAEKVMSTLDSQRKNTWRAKDLMDVYNLLQQNPDIDKVKSWFNFKVENSKFSLEDYKIWAEMLQKNKESRLIELHHTLSMYDNKSFEWNKITTLIEKIIKF